MGKELHILINHDTIQSFFLNRHILMLLQQMTCENIVTIEDIAHNEKFSLATMFSILFNNGTFSYFCLDVSAIGTVTNIFPHRQYITLSSETPYVTFVGVTIKHWIITCIYHNIWIFRQIYNTQLENSIGKGEIVLEKEKLLLLNKL